MTSGQKAKLIGWITGLAALLIGLAAAISFAWPAADAASIKPGGVFVAVTGEAGDLVIVDEELRVVTVTRAGLAAGWVVAVEEDKVPQDGWFRIDGSLHKKSDFWADPDGTLRAEPDGWLQIP